MTGGTGSARRIIGRAASGLALAAIAVGTIALAERYHFRWDWTVNRMNSLSPVSQRVLAGMGGEIEVFVAARAGSYTQSYATDLVSRFQRHHPGMRLETIDRRRSPARARALGLVSGGAAALRYQGRLSIVSELSEQRFTEALYRVSGATVTTVASPVGQGGRRLAGKANFDLGLFGGALRARGIAVRELVLTETGAVPDEVTVLLLTDAPVPMLPAVEDSIREYLERGGHLLWLAEPGPGPRPHGLAGYLGVRFLAGTVVHAKAGGLSRLAPEITLLTRYPPHPITRGLTVATLFPGAAGIETAPGAASWTAQPLLAAPENSRLESGPVTGPVTGRARPDAASDRGGPVNLGLTLHRPRRDREQRVVVLGDGDFLSNAYLGNQGNLELGLKTVDWLARPEAAIEIPTSTAPDRDLVLGGRGLQVLALAAVVGLPLALVLFGAGLWLYRRRA